MNLNTYEELLIKHDWFYHFSDDLRTYRAGQDNEKKLITLSNTSIYHKMLYDKWVEWCDTVITGNVKAKQPVLGDLLLNYSLTTEQLAELREQIDFSYAEYAKSGAYL